MRGLSIEGGDELDSNIGQIKTDPRDGGLFFLII